MNNACSLIYTGRSNKERLWRLIAAFILISTLFFTFTASANADYGPKPSVIIVTEELPESVRYATLLAAAESYGRYHAVDQPIKTNRGEDYDRAYNAFLEYAEKDAYYFWGRVFEPDDGYFSWSYYPPEQFKVLLYDIDQDMIYAGGETERYTLDSIYKASILPDGTVKLSKAPYILRNILNFCIRLGYTVTVEVLLALLFGYRRKKEILFITAVNLVTQFALNLFLSFSDHFLDAFAWGVVFPIMELAIIIGESIAYARCLKSHSRKRAVLYAVTANIVTLLSGVLVAWLLV